MTIASVLLQIRRDTAANLASFTPAQGELIGDVTNKRVIIGDGATAGGIAAAKLSEVLLASSAGAANGTATLNASSLLTTAQMPALTGDVTTAGGALATTIAANAVTNAKAAQMAALTLKGNNTGSTANAADLTVSQVMAMTHPSALAYAIRGVNLNATGDTAVTLTLPTGVSLYAVSAVRLSNASVAPSATARVGVYTAAAQGGIAVCPQQAINALTAFSAGVATNVLSLSETVAAPTAFNSATLYFNVGTANGSAATADVILILGVY